MPASTTTDQPRSPEERKQRRRSRRRKRSARLAGPFLGIPLLLGTLMLSVDLIEYDLQPEGERLVDRPNPEGGDEKAHKRKQSDKVPATREAEQVHECLSWVDCIEILERRTN